ncbi:Hsp70 family protein [Aspergillus melleus]|uniref:Hsp70 family protein n=1 Tax=Aspergillus melleus TaxID=138277 RepID=UPI001E8E96EF|nr:uncharacterized protein LDX57_005790 [Aspergillus melleus]KAH8428085.1 hypothetical protein LDX57_005790 [Aspergillus melleus]
MASGPSYLVGIDFGTTYSGVAWALEGSQGFDEEITVLSTWQDKSNRTYAKVPSVVAYDDNYISWGYQVDSCAEGFRGVKLLLDEDQKLDYAPSLTSRKLLKIYNTDAVGVTADYLECLVEHAKEMLKKDRLMPEKSTLNLRFILTVPAVWSDKAKDATMRAAIQAGISPEDLSLISEPEAAALHALRKVLPGSFSENDTFIVCDAGGGTVDLISYRIKTLVPLEIVEVTEGTGRACGSMFLDERFEDLLRGRMGAKKYDSLSNVSKDAVRTYWQERVKPYYTGGQRKKTKVSIASRLLGLNLNHSDTSIEDEYAETDKFIPIAGAQDDPRTPIVGGCFPLSPDDLESIFEPIVRDVEQLVAGQVANIKRLGRSTKAIVLVGGFGSSHYLFRRLQEGNPTVKILQPEDAWSAVVRGAVHRGLQGNQVESRIARQHYGMISTTPWKQSIHGEMNKHWDYLEETYKADKMSWFIKKSFPMYEDQPISLNFYFKRRVEDARRHLLHKVTLYCCNAVEAPNVEDNSIRELCIVEADLTSIPRRLFVKKCNSKGVEYYEIHLTLVLNPASAALIFDLQFNGTSYGKVRSKYS